MTDSPPSAITEPFQPRRAEWLVLFGTLAAMFALNFWTYNLYPTVWADEVLWSEPAINLVKTGHFTTSVWQLQPADTFWAAQSPLYCFVLAGWLSVAGTTLQAVRSFNYLLISAGVFLVWYASWRFRLIGRGLYRLLLAPLLLLGYGMSFSFRCSRPDILGMICLVLFALAFSVRSSGRRATSLFLTAALAPWVGVQVGLYVFVACLAAKFFFRAVRFKDLALVAAGLGAGAGSLLCFFFMNGVLPYFMATIFQAANEQIYWGKAPSYLGSVPRRVGTTLGGYMGDFSASPLLLGLLVFLMWFWRRVSSGDRRTIAFLLLLYLAIPLVFSFTAHFAFYYSYMVYVPLAVAFLCAFAGLPAALDRWRAIATRMTFAGALLGALLLGLPLRLALASKFFEIVPRTDYAKIVQAELRPDDKVFAHYTAFFEAKQVVKTVYSPMFAKHFVNLTPSAHEFTPEEKQNVTVLIVGTQQFDDARQYFGGNWTAVTEPFGDSFLSVDSANIPLLGRRLQNHFATPQLQRYKLQIFRRTKAVVAEKNRTNTVTTFRRDSI